MPTSPVSSLLTGRDYLLEIGKKFKKPTFHLKEVYTGYNQE